MVGCLNRPERRAVTSERRKSSWRVLPSPWSWNSACVMKSQNDEGVQNLETVGVLVPNLEHFEI